MAVEITPLGFQKPDGGEAVRDGDNIIAANAQKSEDLIQGDRGRLNLIETKNAAQDTAIAATLVDANAHADGQDDIHGAATLADAKAYADAQDATRDTDTLNNATSYADNGDAGTLADAKTYTDGQVATDRGRLSAIETKNTAQDTDIANARTNAAADAKTYADGTFIPEWKATTAYVAGQRVISPGGDIVSAEVNFTSGATYSATNWNASTQDGRLGAVETKNTDQDGRLDGVETDAAALAAAGPLTGASALTNPDVVFSVTDATGHRSWLEVDSNGGPTPAAATAISGALPLQQEETAALVDTTAVYSVTDATGHRSWLEVDSNGGPTFHTVEMLKSAGLITGAGAVTEADLDPGLAARIPAAFSVADAKIGKARVLAVRDSAGQVRPLTSDPLQVSFWGDSLFDGYPVPPFAADQSDSLPGVFATLYTAGTVYNFGKQGEPADEIAIRQGGLVPMLTVAGGSIPASGSVNVTSPAVFGWRLDRGPGSTTGTLAGVPGTLTYVRTASPDMTFTRTTPGAAVPVAGAVPWESYGRAYAGGVQVIMAGRNDIGYNSPVGVPSVDRVVTATAAMVESLTPMNRRVLLLGTTTSTAETKGSNGHTQVTGISAALKALYPQYFWDYRAWLVNEAIYELGITPTAGDLVQMAGDTLPSSIMTDPVHYSPATAAKAAARIKTELTNRGWI